MTSFLGVLTSMTLNDIELSKYEVLLTTLILSLLYSVHMHFQTSGSKLCQIFGLPLGQIFCTMGRLSSVCLSSSSVTHAMCLNGMSYRTKYYACDSSLHEKFRPSSAKKIFSNLGLNRGRAEKCAFFKKISQHISKTARPKIAV